MTKFSLSHIKNHSIIMVRALVKNHGDMTLVEISEDGLNNLSGDLYDPSFELDHNYRLIIEGVDIYEY